MRNLLKSIDAALTDIGHGWCDPVEAHALATSVLAIRPALSVEIGVFAGKGMVSLGLAHKMIGKGKVIGIDPYLASESVKGQLHPNDQKFWGELDHDGIYRLAIESIGKFGLLGIVELVRKTSDDYEPTDGIGVLRIDGNHGEIVCHDVERYGPKVIPGGFLFLNDTGWTGGAVLRAAAILRQQGWKELYRIGDTIVFQR